MKNKIATPILFLLLQTLPSCTLVDLSELLLGSQTEVTFQFRTEQDDQPADPISATYPVNRLQAVIYHNFSGELSPLDTITESWSDALRDGMRVKLYNRKTYAILFWADDKDNTAYSFTEGGTVNVDYSDYLDSGAQKMKEMYALYCSVIISPDSPADSIETIPLKSPAAHLRFTDTSPAESARLTFESLPSGFNPFTGALTSYTGELTFEFDDIPLGTSGNTFNISENYIVAPSDSSVTITCTAGIIKGGAEIASYSFNGDTAISIEQGKEYEISLQTYSADNNYSIWDGTYPTASTLTVDPADPSCYIIDSAEDIVWLSEAAHTDTLGSGLTFKVITDIDMGHKSGQQPLHLPAKSTFDGNGHTLKGLELKAGLFGETARNLNVMNMNIEDSKVEGVESADVGMLVNTLKGSSSFTNINIRNSHVRAADGAAGGIAGYISRKSKSSRAEKMNVIFENCHIYDTDISGTTKEGWFVGLFRGYDNGETIIFRSDCSVTPINGPKELKSIYIEGNEGLWISENDFSHFNAWLGGEECFRGIVIYGENRFIPRWDGQTQVKPLLAKPEYDDTPDSQVIEGEKRIMIYSAFDLAGAKSKVSASPAAIYFRENVDMYGAGADGITYVPEEFAYSAAESGDDNYTPMFTYVDLLEGNNHTVYNMNITSGDGTITSAAFIRSTRKSTETIHRNLNFYNCNVISRVKSDTGKDGTEEDHASGAIVMGKVSSSSTARYTMENIHVYNSRVFALQGIGILTAHLRGTMVNCTVNDCHIENYRCEDHLEPFTQVISISQNEVTVRADFYSYGEVGPLAGMILGEATVTDSHVRGTTIQAWGQNDQEASITGEGTLGKLAATAATNIGFYLVPGRHVSTLIGDVRTKKGETIVIEGCTADSETICLPVQYMHSSKAPFIGQAYYVQFLDTKGTVIVDGHTLTLADGNRNTVRD